MREARIHLQRTVLNQLGREECGVGDWHNLIVITVQDEHWDVDRLQVFREVGFGKRLDAIIVWLCAAYHALAPPVVDHTFRHFGSGTVETVERARGNVAVELCTIRSECGTKAIKHLDREAAGVLCGLDHDRWYCADEDRLRHSSGSVPGNVARHFSTTRRMTDVHCISDIQVL